MSNMMSVENGHKGGRSRPSGEANPTRRRAPNVGARPPLSAFAVQPPTRHSQGRRPAGRPQLRALLCDHRSSSKKFKRVREGSIGLVICSHPAATASSSILPFPAVGMPVSLGTGRPIAPLVYYRLRRRLPQIIELALSKGREHTVWKFPQIILKISGIAARRD